MYGYETEAQRDARGFKAGRAAPGGEVCDRCDLGILVGRIFGLAGILGISSMAIICAVTNSNGSVYYALMQTYGDDIDCACMPILAINDGPFLTLVALGASGLADIPIMSLWRRWFRSLPV